MKQKRKYTKQKGQGIVEYLIIIAAIIALMLVVFRRDGTFYELMQDIFRQQGDSMLNAARDTF